jgi:hypothetical protein
MASPRSAPIGRRRTQPVRKRQWNLGFSRIRNMTHGERLRRWLWDPQLLSRPALAQFSVVLGRTELPGHSAPKSGGLFPEQRWVLQLSIAVDLRCVPDLLKTNRQRAPRQMWNDVERPLHVLANLVIAVGLVPGFLDGEWSGAPAAVRHDRVRAHKSAARRRIDGVSLGYAQGKQKRTSCRER